MAKLERPTSLLTPSPASTPEWRVRPALARSTVEFCTVERLEDRALFSAADPMAMAALTAHPLLSPAVTPTPTPTPTPVPNPTPTPTPTAGSPSIRTSDPGNNSTNVDPTGFISCDLNLPNGGVDATTLTPATVILSVTKTGEKVSGVLNTTGAGDAIIFHPSAPLQPNTSYTFVVTAGVKDIAGAAFQPFQAVFTTGAQPKTDVDPEFSSVGFQKVALPNTVTGQHYLCDVVGPDGKLYVATDQGRILRFAMNADGTLAAPDVITTIRDNNGGQARFVVGMAFAPGSTADNPTLWVTHTAAGIINVADWTGSVSVLTGPNLDQYRDVLIHLPRSFRDHVTGQPTFGPDGALYFCQPSNTAMGAPDPSFGNRPEHQLTASILRLDVAAVAGLTAPIDVMTRDGGGTFDPNAPGSPLTIFATGVRNSYDLLWHSNGQLYASVNGSAAGGNTPASPDGNVPGLTNVSQAFFDTLYRIIQGRYYGHPNPQQREYVLQGGNPTPGTDPFEISDYPVGVTPPPEFRGAIFNFGLHESPDGLIEYKGNAFGGALNGKILVCRYSGGGDIEVLEPSSNKLGILKSQTDLPGMTGFKNPLDLTEDPNTGNLYVVEYNASSGSSDLVLLQPAVVGTPTPTPIPTPTPTPPPPPVPDVFINDATITEGDAASQTVTLTVTLSQATTVAVDVPYATADGTATAAGNDYVPATGTLHFAPGDTSQQIALQVNGDTTVEPDEQFFVNLGEPVNGKSGDNQGAVTVVNNDVPPPPPIRSRSDIKLILKIQKYALSHTLPVPDTTYTLSAQLKAVYTGEKTEVSRRAFIAKIDKYAAAHHVTAPDLTDTPLADLKGVYNDVKAQVALNAEQAKVVALATKKKYTLPDLSGMTRTQLKQLEKVIKKFKPPAVV